MVDAAGCRAIMSATQNSRATQGTEQQEERREQGQAERTTCTAGRAQIAACCRSAPAAESRATTLELEWWASGKAGGRQLVAAGAAEVTADGSRGAAAVASQRGRPSTRGCSGHPGGPRGGRKTSRSRSAIFTFACLCLPSASLTESSLNLPFVLSNSH